MFANRGCLCVHSRPKSRFRSYRYFLAPISGISLGIRSGPTSGAMRGIIVTTIIITTSSDNHHQQQTRSEVTEAKPTTHNQAGNTPAARYDHLLASGQCQADVGQAAVVAQATTLREARRLGGFSAEIRMLSESSVRGLWLTEFSMFRSASGDPRLNLAGRAHKPAAVGDYVEELKAHGGLSGYTFADIEVLSNESESTFRLMSS